MEDILSACVLMIEDDQEMVFLGKLILEKEGYDFISATEGGAGLKILADQGDSIDLVLLDIMLPNMYGWDILERIKKNEQTKHIPVIMLTARHQMEDESETSHYADLYSAYIVKPFVVRQFLDSIAKVIDQSKNADTLGSTEV